jgi:hypothetical protein
VRDLLMFCGNQKHSFHIVTQSPWPILAATGVFILVVGMVMVFHFYNGMLLIKVGLCLVVFVAYNW